ncbi:cupin [Candidatus Saccharibacteria bacterium]|nr:cupin [Candidatus Saccharibacteria bacterium]
MDDVPKYDAKDFSIDSYVKRIDKPWGYELHWAPDSAPYMGKIIHINAGARLSLQVHDAKQESWLLISGEAAVIWEDITGDLVETILEMGKGYSTKIGQKHRLMGVTDCDIVEVSTPELGTTWRLDDDYARPHETPQQRGIERSN